MTCEDVKEQISLAVDNRLAGDLKNAFDHHIESCQRCKHEFELERLTKLVVSRAIRRASVPVELMDRIIAQLSSSFPEQATDLWLQRWRAWKLKPALALAVLAIIILLLFVSLPVNIRHTHTSPDDNNMIHQAWNNYDAIIAGRIKPEITSSDPAEVKTFFAQRIAYPVHVPRTIGNCRLIGGLISNYEGKRVAHVVYKDDDQVAYLCQVDMSTVTDQKTLTIPDEAREHLEKTGWYVLSHGANCSLVMWLVDNTLCMAVAAMDKNELISYLTTPDE